jgi:hypothetical protein
MYHAISGRITRFSSQYIQSDADLEQLPSRIMAEKQNPAYRLTRVRSEQQGTVSARTQGDNLGRACTIKI